MNRRSMAVVATLVFTSCGVGSFCSTGSTQSCTCASGATGTQTCQSDGTFDACSCLTNPTGGGAATGGGSATGGGDPSDGGDVIDGGSDLDAGVVDAGVPRGPHITVTPDPLDFGVIGFIPSAPQLIATRQLHIRNDGLRPSPPNAALNLRFDFDQPFTVTAISGDLSEFCVGDYDSATNTCSGALPSRYDPNVGLEGRPSRQQLDLPVHFIPQTAGLKSYELVFFTNDPVTPAKHVSISVTAVIAQPCDYSVSSPTIDFGKLDDISTATQTFTLHNNGADICYFDSFALLAGTAHEYSLVNTPENWPLDAGADATITVKFAPEDPRPNGAQFTGTLGFSVPMLARSHDEYDVTALISCVNVTPLPVDFGEVAATCTSTQSFLVDNRCYRAAFISGPTVTDSADVGAGTGNCVGSAGCPQFTAPAPTSTNLDPGEQRVFTVSATPQVAGPVSGNLTISAAETSAPYTYDVLLNVTGVVDAGDECASVTCPPAMTVDVNTEVQLPLDAGALSNCAWNVLTRPQRADAGITDPASCSTTYVPDTIGTHVLRFTGTSGAQTASCTTPITVVPDGDLWIELTWSGAADLDLSLTHPYGSVTAPFDAATFQDDVWSANWSHNNFARTQGWGQAGIADDPFLNVDSLGNNTESMRIASPEVGINYGIGVHAASGSDTYATMKVYCGRRRAGVLQYTVPAGALWVAAQVNFLTATSCTFVPLGVGTGVLSTYEPEHLYPGFTP